MISWFYKIEEFVNTIFKGKMRSLCWHILKGILNIWAPFYYSKSKIRPGKSSKEYLDGDVIISLTTFPKRIKTLPLVLESLFRQTVKPTRIVLWLAEEQFPDKNAIKIFLKRYIDLGLEIRFCDDLRAHKKYYYAMKEYPDAYIVTFDDDIFCPENMLEKLLLTYKEHPHCIVTQRAHEMRFDTSGKLLPYGKWNYLAKGCIGPSRYLCATGGAGCLYFPGALVEETFDKEKIKSLCLGADDIWLKCMSFLKGTKIVLTGINNPEIIDVRDNKKNGLAKQNVEMDMNDVQLLAVTEHYRIDWSKDYATKE